MSFFKKFIGKGNAAAGSAEKEPHPPAVSEGAAKNESKSSPNKPYDESVDVLEDEDIRTPREDGDEDHDEMIRKQPSMNHRKFIPPNAKEIEQPSDDSGGDEAEGEEDEGTDDDDMTPAGEGAYDPAEFQNLPVSSDIKELFQYIIQYIPQNIELETSLKPFIPDYMPAVGDTDPFIKIPRPDEIEDNVGLIVLDEPCARQSDSVVLDLHLRAVTKEGVPRGTVVKRLQRADKNPKEIESWIKNISELHRSKPATNVHYSKPMPDIDSLMQEWPSEFEELLKEVDLPGSSMDMPLEQYVDMICSILDIPVYKSRIQSLHVLFTLYSEFKNSQHFRALADDNRMENVGPIDDKADRLVL